MQVRLRSRDVTADKNDEMKLTGILEALAATPDFCSIQMNLRAPDRKIQRFE
jgi:hypothetical protein